ncbi:MAG: CcmD family protein [Flavobacteriales bacterium]
MIKKTTLLLLSFIALISKATLAQDSAIEQTFHESGKINVVVAVVTVIFIGLIFYLIKLDRKISKLEKDTEK